MLRKNINKINVWIIFLFILLLLIQNFCLAAINVTEIIANMQKVYEKQMAGVADYVVVQKPIGGISAMAGETKIYYKKARVDGEEIYKTRTETEVMGMSIVSIYDGKYNWSTNPMTGKVESELVEVNRSQFWKNINSSNTQYLGEETINGEKAYVLQIDDAINILGSYQMQTAPMQQEASQKGTGKLWLSSKTWLPLRMMLVMTGDSEEMTMNIVTTIDFQDYRQVGTMFHPFHLVINTSTEIDTSTMSSEERKEAEEAMKMMQSMMSGMGSFTIETTDIKVNAGLSDDLFDGTKLK